MSRPLQSYESIAQAWGVEWCRHAMDWKRDEKGNLYGTWVCVLGDHHKGFAEPSVGRVHFEERRPTRRGIRNFLMLIADVYLSHNRGQPMWLKVYQRNVWADREAKTLRLRFPLVWSRDDRLYVRSRLLRMTSYRRSVAEEGGPIDYDAIVRWTQEV